MIFTLSILLTVAAVSVSMAMLPAIQSPGTPLGVRVPRERLNELAVRGAIGRYRLFTLLVGVAAAAVVLAGVKFPLLAGLSSVVVIVGSLWAYVTQRKHIINAKVAGGWFDEVETAITGAINTPTAGETSRRLAEFPTPRTPWLWIANSALSIVISVLIVAQHWAEIPDVVATHWGPQLEADAWADKSIWSVFSLSFINTFMLVLFAGVTSAITWGYVRGRNDQTIRGRLRASANLAAANQGMGILMFLIICALSLAQIVTVTPGLERWMGPVFVTTLVLSVGSIFPLLGLVMRAQGKVDALLRGVTLPDDNKESPDNDQYYKWGVFYYNPNDPAVLVEKRAGVGMDFNYGTWQGKAFLAFVVLVLLASVLLPLLL